MPIGMISFGINGMWYNISDHSINVVAFIIFLTLYIEVPDIKQNLIRVLLPHFNESLLNPI